MEGEHKRSFFSVRNKIESRFTQVSSAVLEIKAPIVDKVVLPKFDSERSSNDEVLKVLLQKNQELYGLKVPNQM